MSGQAAQPTAAENKGAAEKAAPPEEFQALYDHVVTCGKCGFCQPACPIFRATGREANVARGKVALFRNIVEERTEIGPDTKEAFANCLLCRACTESCFSAVKTDKVVISFRHAYADRFGRGLLQRGVFRFLLPRPRLMRGLGPGHLGHAQDRPARPGPPGRLDRPAQPEVGAGDGVARRHPGTAPLFPPEGPAAPGTRAGSGSATPLVGYWMSCGYNYVLPEVGEATVRVLERLGNRVEVLDNCCCGLAAYGYGDLEAAANLARENLRRLGDVERFDAIVSECGSCSGHLKEYAELLAEDPEWAERAALLTKKVRSFSEFVEERGGLAAAGAVAGARGAAALPAAAPSAAFRGGCRRTGSHRHHLPRALPPGPAVSERHRSAAADPALARRLRVPGSRGVRLLLRSGRHLRGAPPGDVGCDHRTEDGLHQGHRGELWSRPSARPA